MQKDPENSDIRPTNNNYYQHKPLVSRGFGRGHIIYQYMSGVGVITERYVSNSGILLYQSRHSSDPFISKSDVKSRESLTMEEEDEEVKEVKEVEEEEDDDEEFDTSMPVNCPCYEYALKIQYESFQRVGLFRNIISKLFNFKSS